MVNCRKYISNRRSYAYIRRTSDRLCRENGLSVVKPGKDKGKSYAEWDAQRKGKSWKAKLKIAIDAAIPQAKDFDDFLRLMQAQGYEIKQGKVYFFPRPPDRNASPAARPWVRTTPKKPLPAGSRGWPWTEARNGKPQRKSPCGLIWRTASRPSRARAMQKWAKSTT